MLKRRLKTWLESHLKFCWGSEGRSTMATSGDEAAQNDPANHLPNHDGVDLPDVTGAQHPDVANMPDVVLNAKKSNEKTVAKIYGCSHYERRCAYVSPCCKKVYPCRICHDDIETHQINRHAVTEIVCLICDTQQAVGRSCASCGVEFGRYFCPICRLFDDKDKKQFHCDQCGICRVDGRENFFHCPKCDICLCINLKDSHKCVEQVTHANCPVCLEDLHTSRENLSVLSCGHITHSKCFRGLLRSGIYACPLCCHTMVDMQSTWRSLDLEIANTPMPEEYRDVRVTVLCRDCHKVCSTAFHIIGLKCRKCGSYNTCRESSSRHHTDTDEEDESSASSSSSPVTRATNPNGSIAHNATDEEEGDNGHSATSAAASSASAAAASDATSASASEVAASPSYSAPSKDHDHPM